MESDYIKLIKSNCKNCHKCIRNCPVKSISFIGGEASIIAEECLLCGQCYAACPQNAKRIRSDYERVREAIKNGAEAYASIAPSFVANYRGAGIASMKKALKALGFMDAGETAVGASMVKTRYEEMIDESSDRGGVLISSCCPVINDLIRMYHPEVLSCLADVVTPAEAHCRSIKREHTGAVTVFIGPCIAKKKEADNSSAIDYAITFEELTRWLGDEGVLVEPMVVPTEDACDESRARLFPTSNGVIRTMKRNENWVYVSVDGMDNCKRAIKEIASGELHNCFVEMSACAGSCVGGPVMEKMRARPISDNAIIFNYAGKRDFAVPQPEAREMEYEYSVNRLRRVNISDAEINAVLLKMGKTSPEKELNCGFCGYDTCRDKAYAVCVGKAETDMCLPYLMEKAQSFSDIIIDSSPSGVIVLNESMQIQQLNSAACAMLNIKRAADLVGEQVVTILDPKAVFEALRGEKVQNRPAYLPEYRKFVEQSVVVDKKSHIIIIMLRDTTSQEAARTRRENVSSSTIEVADRVIENQMRVVQEIASLLGETAADTKVALTKLKESLNGDE